MELSEAIINALWWICDGLHNVDMSQKDLKITRESKATLIKYLDSLDLPKNSRDYKKF